MRNKRSSFVMSGALATLLFTALLLAGCERPPIESVQRGYRGTGMEQLYNPRIVQAQAAANTAPAAPPAVPEGGPKASETFKNVKVLGDLGAGEFTRLMVAMTSWVAPEKGCNYCHNPADLADDSVYTKVVARKMIEMTRHINADWQKHVSTTGVTCYTCHRGKPVPDNIWFAPPLQGKGQTYAGNDAGQNKAAASVAMASLPYDPFSAYLGSSKQPGEIRVVSDTALPAGNPANIMDTEQTYGLMMHMSQALGVNCTYCHNTRSFADWGASTPQRATAWHGIRLARDLNEGHLTPLQGTFPAARLGPQGDVAKVNCATCHQGAYKPLYGAAMAKDFPSLGGAAAAK
jgi:photosynthetic reaction center cytochrome c subunit